MESILSKFLAAGLLPIGEDDEKLKLLEAAAAELARQIDASPSLTYRFTLVGLDDRIAITDPVIKKAEETVREKWATITNKVGASPIQVYRAVILRAIELAVADKSALRQAVSLIVQNEPALHIKGAEKEPIISMLTQLEAKNSEELADTWVRPVSVSLPKLAAKPKKTSSGKEELTAGLARASGPTDKDGKAMPTPNPHTPAEGQPWSNEFVGRAADAIFAAIQTSSKNTIDDIQETVRESIQSLVTGIERLAIRDAKSELLWIRTSLYSPSARSGYRKLSDAEILLYSSLDISRAVAPSAPPSVDFFLRDLVVALADKKLKLEAVLSEVGVKLAGTAEGALMDDSLPASGRRSWLDTAVRPNNELTFEEQTGVAKTYEDSVAELAVKFYRELQIRKLLSTAA